MKEKAYALTGILAFGHGEVGSGSVIKVRE